MIKSLKKLKEKRNSQPKPRESKSEIATVAPKAIVKALYDYEAQRPDEMSFKQHDFLYVVDNSDQDWYLACNPLTESSGLVPVLYFEVIQRPEVIPSVSLSTALHKTLDGGEAAPVQQLSPVQTSSNAASVTSGAAKRRTLAIYGFVLYDFAAERNDELEAKRGESIIIIAQSNSEWFVAKPIGRLGGPGLIPVSYVQIREVGTDKPYENIEEAMRLAEVPQVEEWKRRAAEYKASSISLGKFEEASAPSAPVANVSPPKASSVNADDVYITSARVDRFAINGGRYWYLVSVELSNGRYRNLCRYYQDFYDFQIKLLEEFPEEAGRTGKPRTLPFMPGPLTMVNHSISSQRRANLDEYVRKLICMPPHISRSELINQLFALRAGDIEADEPTNVMPQPPEEEAPPSSDTVVRQQQYQMQLQQQQQEQMQNTNWPSLQPQQYQYQQQASNDRDRSHARASSAEAQQGNQHSASSQEHVKVKVFCGSELIAIRIPASLSFDDLYKRIASRLGIENPTLSLSNDFNGQPIASETAFRQGIVGGKIVLYAK